MDKDKKQGISLAVFVEMIRNSARISKLIWNEKKGMVIVLIFAFLLVSVTPFIQSGSVAVLINELTSFSGDLNKIIFWVSLMILAGLLTAFARIFQDYISKIFYLFINDRIMLMVLKKRGELDIASQEDPKINDLIVKANDQGQYRAREFANRQYFLLQNLAEVLIASVILFLSSWWIFLIVFIGTIPELITEARYGKHNYGLWSAKAEDRRRFWDLSWHFQRLSKIQELKLFQNINHFLAIIKGMLTGFQNDAIKNEKKKLFAKLVSGIISQGVMAFAIFWFVFEVVHGNILIGTLTFILASMYNLKQSLAGMFMNLAQQYEDNLFTTDMFKLLDLPKAIKAPEKGITLPKNKTPEIVFDNVTFGYPGTDKIVLKNFSLRIMSGEKVAIIGVNGAGKTTLIKLLCRFYDPTAGRITIGGHDLRDIDLESWYYQMGIIFQDYAQYNFLIKEAIAVGRTEKGTDIEKVKIAAKAVEADIFIEEWEKNYNQQLGKEWTGGVEPSIGQWQKLALARTFYRDPRVLILDEPTSSIDAEAEAKIFEKLENLPDDRTVILISHRFSTVRKAHKIIVIKDGELSESGTHEELIKLNGTYAKLFNLQAKGYK